MWRIQQPLPAPACTGKSGNPALLPNPSVSKAPRASARLLSLHGTARAWLLLQGKKNNQSHLLLTLILINHSSKARLPLQPSPAQAHRKLQAAAQTQGNFQAPAGLGL